MAERIITVSEDVLGNLNIRIVPASIEIGAKTAAVVPNTLTPVAHVPSTRRGR